MARLTAEVQACFPETGPIAEYVRWAATTGHAPPIMHLASILPVVGYELIRRGFQEPRFGSLVQWIALIAPSGSTKTTQMRLARVFSEEWYSSMFASDIAPEPWLSLEGSMAGVLHAAAQLPTVAGRTPGILYHSEFSKVLRSDDVSDVLNQLYDGDPYERNLRYLQKLKDGFGGSNVKARIADPAFTLLALTTPISLEGVIRPEMLQGGLYARFLWIRAKLNRDDLQPWPQRIEQSREALLNTWRLWFSSLEGSRLTGLAPEIELSDAAEKYLESVFKLLGDSIVGDGFDSTVTSRILPHATRIACYYAASRFDRQGNHIIVSEDDAARAAALVLHSAEYALALGTEIGATSLAIDAKQRQILQLATRAGTDGVSRREIYRAFSNKLDKQQIEALLAALIDQERIVEQPVGRALKVFTVEAYAKREPYVPGSETIQ